MKRPSNAALRMSNVGKKYVSFSSSRQRLKSLLWKQVTHEHWVLRNVSLTLNRGDCMGVVGDNGAGKSSLLKLIARTITPSEGKIECSGRITAILELGAGFHPDFSGRENLRFSGRLIGLSRTDIERLEPEIIEFSELGESIDRPVKAYSSGMVVRLAFSLVTAMEPDILIIDEALAVGDQHFQKKCIDRIEFFRNNGCTILFCSHSLYHVKHLCNKSLWLDKGKVKALGDTDLVLAQYEQHVRQFNTKLIDQFSKGPISSISSGDAFSETEVIKSDPNQDSMRADEDTIPQSRKKYAFKSIKVDRLSRDTPPQLLGGDLVVTMRATGSLTPPSFGIMIEQVAGVGITSAANHADGSTPRRIGQDQWESRVTFSDLPLLSGDYVLSAYLFDEKGMIVLDERPKFQIFRHTKHSLTPGLLTLPHAWN